MKHNRRHFLTSVAGVAGLAAVAQIPATEAVAAPDRVPGENPPPVPSPSRGRSHATNASGTSCARGKRRRRVPTPEVLRPAPRDLERWRMQYALYKSDPDLQAAHGRFPWVVTRDDHEVQNDYADTQSQSWAAT